MPFAQARKNANPHGSKQFITILTKTVSGLPGAGCRAPGASASCIKPPPIILTPDTRHLAPATLLHSSSVLSFSSTEKSSSVVTSPATVPLVAISRSSRRIIFPDLVFGKASEKRISSKPMKLLRHSCPKGFRVSTRLRTQRSSSAIDLIWAFCEKDSGGGNNRSSCCRDSMFVVGVDIDPCFGLLRKCCWRCLVPVVVPFSLPPCVSQRGPARNQDQVDRLCRLM
jgi:hypothetical protein